MIKCDLQNKVNNIINLSKFLLTSILLIIFSFNFVIAQETIKSASEYDYPPFSIVTEDGEADGFSVELLKASLSAVSREVDFYVGPWNEIKEDLVEGKIDVLPLVGRTPEREIVYDFTVPYLTLYGAIFTREGDTRINTLEDLVDKKIVVMKGDNSEEFISREQITQYITTTDTFEEAFKSLSEGEHDAVITQKIMGMELLKKIGINNIVPVSEIKEFKQDFTFAVKEGDQGLLALLNDGLSKIISNGVFDDIYNKWLDHAEENLIIELTPEEKVWIEEHPVIKLGAGSWDPYVTRDKNGDLVGLSVDFTNLINEHAGTNIEVVDGVWSNMVQHAIEGSIDGLAMSTAVPARESYFFFSEPYFTDYLMIVLPSDTSLIINEINDFYGKTIVFVKETFVERILVESIPGVNALIAASEDEAIKLMLEGRADAAVLTASKYSKRNKEYLNLIKIGYVANEQPIEVLYSINKSSPELFSIINKVLRSISPAQKDKIYSEWFGETLEPEKEDVFEEQIIKLIALQIANEVDDYLEKNPQKTIEDLQNDKNFKLIATQQVGETGYVALIDSQSGEFYFHPREQFVGTNLAEFKEDFNDLWKILEATRGKQCTESSGYYEWEEVEGEATSKYLSTSCVKNATADGENLFVAATTYLTEIEGDKYLKKYGVVKTNFAEESIEQKAKDVARQIEIYLNANPDMTLVDLQNDAYFQDIAVQSVGKTGYTTVTDYNDLVVLFHPAPETVGLDINSLRSTLPELWEVMARAQGGNESMGLYEWEELNGDIKDKYTYVAIVDIKTSDDIGLMVAATTYLDEYEEVKEAKEPVQRIPMIWFLGSLILLVLISVILSKLNIIKFERNVIMFFLAIALMLIIGLFVYNAYNITENLKEFAIDNEYNILSTTASTKQINIEQYIKHIKNSFKIFSSSEEFSNEELKELVKLSGDFSEIFILDSNGTIRRSSDISHIGLSRLTDPYFLNAGKGEYIKPIYLSGSNEEVVFSISSFYNGGALVAKIKMDQIQDIISGTEGLGETGESLLAYRKENGDAVFFTNRRFARAVESREVISKEDIDIPITQALLGNEKESLFNVDYRNIPVFAVTKYIEDLDIGLVVKIDKEEVLERVLENINQIWYSTFGVILTIIIISLFFYFLLTKALRNEVEAKTSAIKKKTEKLERFVSIIIGREEKMMELKKKIKEYEKRVK